MDFQKISKTVCLIALLLTLQACSLFFREETVILYHVQRGDTLYKIGQRFDVSASRLAYENNISSPNSLQIGQVIEIPYRGQKVNTKPLELSKSTKGQVSTPSGKLSWPVNKSSIHISSKFGWRWLKFHEGADFAGKTGVPIYAAHSGKVIVSGYRLSGYGKMVIIQGNNMLTVYAHNSSNYVKAGQYVSRGQKIAAIGSTGKSTGPHLHFEVRIKDSKGKYVAVDPLRYLP